MSNVNNKTKGILSISPEKTSVMTGGVKKKVLFLDEGQQNKKVKDRLVKKAFEGLNDLLLAFGEKRALGEITELNLQDGKLRLFVLTEDLHLLTKIEKLNLTGNHLKTLPISFHKLPANCVIEGLEFSKKANCQNIRDVFTHRKMPNQRRMEIIKALGETPSGELQKLGRDLAELYPEVLIN